MKIKINICISYMIGGAHVSMKRLAVFMPQYQWIFAKTPNPDADIVIYMNDDVHYQKAKTLGIPHIIQRKTGIRSLKVSEHDDIDAVICSSLASYQNSKHPRRQLIYNGIDFNHLQSITPKSNIEWLIMESRHGTGQRTEVSIRHAIKQNKHLTILGSGEGVAENTYDKLVKKYPECNWVGRVSPDEALTYLAGCEAILTANPSHGLAQQCIESVALDKCIIDLTPGQILEIPTKEQIDIKSTAKKYDELFQSILNK